MQVLINCCHSGIQAFGVGPFDTDRVQRMLFRFSAQECM